MIASEWERIHGAPRYRPKTYVGGAPPQRLRIAANFHEGKARREGRQWDFVDLRIVYSAHEGRCGICGELVEFESFTIDHIVPTSKGGPHVFENLQPAHRSCNNRKGSR